LGAVSKSPPSRRALALYVGAVVASGAAALIWVQPFASLGEVTWQAWFFVTCMLIVDGRPIPWKGFRESTDFTASWAFAFAVLLLAPAGFALGAVAVASVVGDVTQRRAASRVAFNAMQFTLALGAGAVVLELVQSSTTQPLQTTPMWLLAAMLGAFTIYVVNETFVALAVSISEGRAVLPLLRNVLRLGLASDAIMLTLAPILVVVVRTNPALVPLTLVITWTVYRFASLAELHRHEAAHDLLTGLPNRRAFREHATLALHDAETRGGSIAVALLDLDGFKNINDRLGHHVGDLILQEVAQRLDRACRSGDIVARLGGDEFAIVLLRDIDDAASTTATFERLAATLREPLVVRGLPITLGGSFGVARYPNDGEDVETLIQHADVAMYAAKHSPGDVKTYDETRDRNRRTRLDLLGELDAAISRGELVLHYQPKVRLSTGHLVGVEALVRWQHPRLGLIPPDRFVPDAERTDLMARFTDCIAVAALRQCQAWHSDGLPVSMSINASPNNLHDLRFAERIADHLAASGIDASLFELEITENMLMIDPVRAIDVLSKLRQVGVRLSIDNFGTGYSSLASLRTLPIDAIKIDRSFVGGILIDDDDLAIVGSIIDLARRLRIETVAEGIESDAIRNRLVELGCDFGQGYGIARPGTAREITEWMRQRTVDAPRRAHRV